MKLTAIAQRSGDWWAVEVPQIPGLFTQARRLDQIPDMVLDAASLLLERPETDFEVLIDPQLPAEDESYVKSALTATAHLREAQQAATKESRQTARHLRERGLTVRDAAVLMNVSPQKISQLVKDDTFAPS